MELQQIRYFLALSVDLNFTRAAERCGVSQPSLTRAIKRLESDLGAQLVRRERNRTHLTELGRKIKPQLEQALSLTESARSQADDFLQMRTPNLSIGVMHTVGSSRMMSIVRQLTSENPQLTLTLRTASAQQTIDWLLTGDIDVAVVGMPDYPDEVAVRELYKERYMVAFPADHRFNRMDTVPLHELERETILKRLNCEYLDFFHSTLAGRDPDQMKELADSVDSMDIHHESEHEELIQSMVLEGMGCTVIPEHLSVNADIRMRPLVEPDINRSIGIATVRGRPHSPAVSYFSHQCQQIKKDLDF